MSEKRRTWLELPAIILTGAGIGWLVGMSGSPVLGAVLASILAAVVGVVGAVSGLRRREPERKPDAAELRPAGHVSAIPLALFLLGMCPVATWAARFRSAEDLQPPRLATARAWKSFYDTLGPQAKRVAPLVMRKGDKDLLAGHPASQCTDLEVDLGNHPKALEKDLRTGTKVDRWIAENVKSDAKRESYVRAACGGS